MTQKKKNKQQTERRHLQHIPLTKYYINELNKPTGKVNNPIENTKWGKAWKGTIQKQKHKWPINRWKSPQSYLAIKARKIKITNEVLFHTHQNITKSNNTKSQRQCRKIEISTLENNWQWPVRSTCVEPMTRNSTPNWYILEYF